jgi:hypothetical protein
MLRFTENIEARENVISLAGAFQRCNGFNNQLQGIKMEKVALPC